MWQMRLKIFKQNSLSRNTQRKANYGLNLDRCENFNQQDIPHRNHPYPSPSKFD